MSEITGAWLDEWRDIHDLQAILRNTAETVQAFRARYKHMMSQRDAVIWRQSDLLKARVSKIMEYGREIDHLKESIEAERAKHSWIPVTERLPDLIISTLIVTERGIVDKSTYLGGGEWSFYSKVTHWQPLPEAPQV